MIQDEIKDIDQEEEEDVDFIPKKKGKNPKKNDDDIDEDIKEVFDDDIIDDEIEDDELGHYIDEDEEEAGDWDDVYGYKDEYES